MKIDNTSLAFLLILFALISPCCEEKDNNENEKDSLKNRLVGQWIEIYPCDSCYTLTFTEYDTIIHSNKWDNTNLTAFYQAIAKDSIRVSRNWEIELEKQTTEHKVVFSTDDTLEIKQFIPVDIGITGFEDIKLYKNN